MGNDGLILVWELASEQRELRVMKVFKLLTGSVPRGIRISRAKENVEIGGELSDNIPHYLINLQS